MPCPEPRNKECLVSSEEEPALESLALLAVRVVTTMPLQQAAVRRGSCGINLRFAARTSRSARAPVVGLPTAPGRHNPARSTLSTLAGMTSVH